VIDSPSPPQAFHLPAALGAEGIALRSETDSDVPFLQALYASTRAFELNLATDWSEAQKWAFILSQFAAQRLHYRRYHPDASFEVIERNGMPIGRLYLEVSETRLDVIDIALMPEWRGQRLGTALLRALIETAHTRKLGVGIFVEKYNPALRLYQRLGFAHIADAEVYLEMEWRSSQANVAQ